MKFFPHAEGYVNVTETCGFLSSCGFAYNYVFNYTDHLGNIRLSYGIDPETSTLKIMEENHYYPFGLKHANYNSDELLYQKGTAGSVVLKGPTTTVESVYKFKFNGFELQDELGLNWYDYQARNYDPALGRWMNIDPLAEKMRRFSPYVYAWDNPTVFVDYDGMFATPPTDFYNLDGKKVKHVDDGKVDKKMVITHSTDSQTVDSAIGNGEYVSAISNSEIAKMEQIYKTHEKNKTHVEEGFVRGTNDTSSDIITGKDGEMTNKALKEGATQVSANGGEATSDVHLHPNTYDSDGNVTMRGTSNGSTEDLKPVNNSSYSEPSIVLGYRESQEQVRDISSGSSSGVGTTTETVYTREVGFYSDSNNGGNIEEKIDFSKLKKTVKKINKDN